MDIKDLEILPGIVVDSDDPQNLGRVKAVVPGYFDEDNMAIDDMIWINPPIMFGYQTFTKLMKGSKVWILHNKKNYYGFWYLPMFEMNDSTIEALSSNSDVLISREDKQIYYNDKDGFVQKNGNNSITLDNNGNYAVNSNDIKIEAKDGKIVAGSKNDKEQPAILGNELCSMLSDTASSLMNIGLSMVANPYVCQFSESFINLSKSISSYCEKIKSKNVFIN